MNNKYLYLAVLLLLVSLGFNGFLYIEKENQRNEAERLAKKGGMILYLTGTVEQMFLASGVDASLEMVKKYLDQSGESYEVVVREEKKLPESVDKRMIKVGNFHLYFRDGVYVASGLAYED